jgi:hypothetical protein
LQIKYKLFVIIYTHNQDLQQNFARRNKTVLGPRDRLTLLSKLRIWGPIKPQCTNVSDDQQPEFRSLSEFYIIIFLNQLKIVELPRFQIRERERESQIRTSMVKAMGPYRDSHVPYWFSGPGPMYQLNPPPHCPCIY